MKPSFTHWILVAFVSAPTLGQAGEIIVHPASTLTAAEVREVFVGDKQLAGNAKLVPVDNSSAQADFVSKVLQMEVVRYNALWTRKAFREGLTAPPVKGGDAEVIAFVKSTPGAVGYVGTSGPGVKVLQKF